MKNHLYSLFLLTIMGLVCCSCKDEDEPTIIKSIDCTVSQISIKPSETSTLEVLTLPEDAEDASYYWEVVDTTIATIQNSTVTAKTVGETWAYVISNSRPEIKDSVKIIVMEIPKIEITCTNSGIRYDGRITKSESSVSFVYPGSKISTIFTGTSIAVNLKQNNSTFYWIEIDDQTPFKIRAYRTDSHWVEGNKFLLANGLKSGSHTAKITLVSEGLYSKPAFYGFEIDSAANLTAPTDKSLKMEFIGNSITCGYGVEASSNSQTFNDSTSNFCKSYAHITATNLNADYMVVARSGIGLTRNYGDALFAKNNRMPNIYFNVDINSSTAWDFTSFTPDIVCVNLGTNDFSTDGWDSTAFDTTYRAFLTKIKGYYPNSKFVLLTGSMMSGSTLTLIKGILNKIATDFNAITPNSVYRYDFPATAGQGADWHPSATQQASMGAKLTEYIQSNILNN